MQMSKGNRSIKVNAVMNALLTVSTVVFQLITFPYISRVLLPAGTGKVAFATSLISYFTMFAQLGIPIYGIRACAKVRDDRQQLTQTAQELLIINVVMSLFAYIALAVCLLFIPKLREERLLYLVMSATILLTSIGMEWLYKALEQYTYITVRSVTFKFIGLLFTLLLVRSESDYVIYGGVSIFALSASYLMNLVHARKYIDFKPLSHYHFRRHLKAVVVFFAMSCATTIYTHLDTLMLGFMKTDVDVGFYNAAVKIRTVLIQLVTSLGAVLLPRATYYIAKGEMDKFYEMTKKAVNFVFLIAVPMTVYFILFAEESVYFLSGEAYGGSIAPMQIIMPTLLLVGITNILGMQMLVPLGKEKTVLYSEIVGAIVVLMVNFTLIPLLASTGAAIGTLAAEVAVLIVQYCSMREEMQGTFKNIQYLKIFIAVVVAVVASLFVKSLDYGYFLTLLCSAILFFGVYGCILLMAKEPLLTELARRYIDKIRHRR